MSIEQIAEVKKLRWVQIADQMRTMQVDDVLTYEWLTDTFPDVSFINIRQDVHRAIKEVEETDSRTFECLRDEGYRMVAANEHHRLARSRHKRARRQIVRAIGISKAARPEEMTPEERVRNDVMLMNSQRLKKAMDSVPRRKYPVIITIANDKN